MDYSKVTKADLENKTGSELVEVYNDLAPKIDKKPVKKFADFEKAVNRTWNAICAFNALDEDDKPVAGKFVRCPNCETHLSNGFLTHGDEINGKVVHLGHEYECMACGNEFGEVVESEDDTRERRQTERRHDEKPEDDPIQKTAKVTKVKEARPALRKDDRILLAGEAPKPRMIVMGAIWEVAQAKDDGMTQGELIERVLNDFEPPRSARFGRDYILGYISWGLQQGYLKEQKAA